MLGGKGRLCGRVVVVDMLAYGRRWVRAAGLGCSF